MPAIASIEDLKPAQREGLRTYSLLWSQLSAVILEVAENRLEERLQAVVTGAYPGGIKG
jgi:hypothetical protein